MVIDPEAPTREGIAAMLREAGIDVLDGAATAEQAVAALRRTPADVCLLEIVAGHAGQAIAAIRHAAPACSIVVYTTSRDHDDLLDALRAGAVGWMLKDASIERLAPVIHGVLAGEVAVPRTMLAPVIRELQAATSQVVMRDDGQRVALTMREADVRRLLREGATTREIADRLGISQVTVRRHRGRLAEKLRTQPRG
jgi:DNA-binding NarL/FixJ family response regulator